MKAVLERVLSELSRLKHGGKPDPLVYDVVRDPTRHSTYVVYGRFKELKALEVH